MRKRKIFSMLLVVVLIVSMFTNAFLFGPLIIISRAGPGDISESWYNETTLNVTVLQLEPRINWYDFQYNQSGAWVSKRNAQIDVNNSAEYRFIVNISSDQGWDDIEYINITSWHDGGGESSTYNQTAGGNLNMYLQYENTTGTANYNMLWPDDEVTKGTMTETVVSDPAGSPGNTECHNITFSFIPGYQFKYAPGDGSWDNTTNTTNDVWSWNFNISVIDSGESAPGPSTTWIIDEFGVYSYTEIVSAGWPTITGNPGQNATADSNISINTRSNGNYSLSVLVDDLVNKNNPIYTISNESIWVRGGNLATSSNYTGSGPLYLYGSASTYESAESNDTSKTTSNVEYKCNIPLGQHAGDYNATIHYHLKTQT